LLLVFLFKRVEVKNQARIKVIIRPVGVIKDALRINIGIENKVAMVFARTRQFKH
jgi:AICAR transformylase/IMP cyclohydrolase PurH